MIVNAFLNKITMYRLMLYYLIFLAVYAVVLSAINLLPYNAIEILVSALYLVAVCWTSNKIFARIFKVKTNPESTFITALILSLIIGPADPTKNVLLLTGAGIFAMASKYILAFRDKHIFNPAAFGVVATALLVDQGASWWIGSLQTFPFVLLGGLLVLKKIRRWEIVGVFLLVYIALSISNFQFPISNLLYSPLLFFSLVMLVEPLTSPTTKIWQMIYGLVVAAATFVIPLLLPDVYYGLELSLLVGNVFSYIVCRSSRQSMILKEKSKLTKDVIAFKFEPSRKFPFKAGQYIEWTLSHPNPDSGGIRRFFTIASSPTENFVMLASKFYENPSTFKQALQKLEPGDEIVISSLSGEFTMPKDRSQKLLFIAGGIGITPFRSMVKYLIDNNEKRDIVLLYSNKTAGDIVFKDLFDEAKNLGVRTVYVNTDKDGYIDEKLIKREVLDWKERKFYISGPEPMVEAFEKMIAGMGIERRDVKRDYFPGYTETHQKT